MTIIISLTTDIQTEQDLVVILQEISVLDASDTMFRPKVSVRASVIVNYESPEGTHRYEYALTNGQRLCSFIRAIGKSSNSLDRIQRFNVQEKAHLKEKIIAFITSSTIVCSNNRITSSNNCSNSSSSGGVSDLASRVAVLVNVYPTYPDKLVKILRRFKLFIESVERER